ncbi:MAG: porin [Gallionella sp.]|nr:porin [Gallionella sp.]
MLNLNKLALLAVSILLTAPNAMADATADTKTKLEALQQQIQALSAELHAMQEQLANANRQAQPANTGEEKTVSKGQSKGEPMYASFKDGLVFDDGTGNWSLQLNGRVQADYRNTTPTQWKNDTFTIRRARLGGTFTYLKDFAVRIEGEFANGNDGAKGTTAMTYGHVDYNHFPGARLRIGQFKPVFGLERAESTNFTDFMELSLATATGPAFNSTYDRGLMLFGAPFKGTYYNLSYVNGSGQNNDSLKDSKDFIGRFAANIADLAEWKNSSVVHLGVSGSKNQVEPSNSPAAGTAYSTALSAYTEANGITSNTAGNTGATATKFFGTDAFTGNVDKNRLGFETALAYGPAKFQGEYITTSFNKFSATTSATKKITASYVSLTWLATGGNYADSYKSGMFNRIYPKQNFSWSNAGFGEVELGLRYSIFDASDFKTTAQGCVAGTGCLTTATAATAYTNKANAWTAGAKWMLTPYARLMLNYVHTKFDTPVIFNSISSNDEKAIAMRAQYDF